MKWARLDWIVGQLKDKEEEPEGEVLGDSNTGSLAYLLYFFSITLLIQFTLALFVLASWLYCSSLFPLRRVWMRGGKAKATHSGGGGHRHNQELGRGWGPPSSPGGRGKGIINRGQIYSHVSLSFFSIDLFATNFPHNLWYFWLLCALSSFFTGVETAPGGKCKKRRGQKIRSWGWKDGSRGVGET